MSKLIKIYPEANERGIFWPYVYLHGIAELRAEHDLVRASVNLSDVADGLHLVTLMLPTGPEIALLGLWSYEGEPGNPATLRRKGLIVTPSEGKDLVYFAEHYHKKSHCL